MSRALQGTRLERGQESALAQTLLFFFCKTKQKVNSIKLLNVLLSCVFHTSRNVFTVCEMRITRSN